MLWHWIRPNAAGMVLLLLFVCTEVLCGRDIDLRLAHGLVTEAPTTWGTSYGFPIMVECIGGPELKTIVRIYWATLLPVLAGAWVVTMLAGRLMTDAGVDPRSDRVLRSRRHPALVLLICVVVTVPLSAAGAAAISKWLFGYWLTMPSPDPRVRDASQILSLTPIFIDVASPGEVIVKAHRMPNWDPSIPARLSRAGLPEAPWESVAESQSGLSIDQLDGLSRALSEPDVFLQHHGTPQFISGYVVEFADAGGREFTRFIGDSAPVTDELTLCFECLLNRPRTGKPQILATRQFFQARGWLAPVDWPVIFRAMLIVLLLLVLPFASLILVVRRLLDRWRVPPGFEIMLPAAPTHTAAAQGRDIHTEILNNPPGRVTPGAANDR